MDDLIRQALDSELKEAAEIDELLENEEISDNKKPLWKEVAKIIQFLDDMDTLNKLIERQMPGEEEEPGPASEIEAPEMSAEAQNALAGALRMLSEYADEMPDELMGMMENIVGGPESLAEILAQIKEGGQNMDMEQVQKSLDSIDLPDNVKEMVQKTFEENQKIKKELQEKKEEQLKKEFIEKAKENYSNLPMSSEDLGLLLKELDEKTDKSDNFEKLLKSVNEILKENNLLFSELGSTQEGESGSSWDKIEKRAEQMVKKSEKGLTKQQAINKILEENPNLYDEYLKEQQKGGK